jgi:NADH-quinone oxidoreductase chain G
MIPITINNRPFLVRPNTTVLQACESASFDVPRFCYHEKLSVAGNCRMCLVEIQKSPKPVVSCAMPVAKDMIIFTDTPLVRKAREAVLEFLLLNHPLDCPICDQGGECDLQDEALNYGSDRGRYYEFKRSVEDKECGPIVKTIMTRCIHCTRCVRFSAEVAGQETLGSFGRGEETEIGTYIQSFIRTELSGNLVDLCPVGALTSKPYAFTARSWELSRVESVDFLDAVCSDISVQTRKVSNPVYQEGNMRLISKEEIVRILPRSNGVYQDNWISDRTRYAFDGLKNQRALTPLRNDRKSVKSQRLTWLEALVDASERLEHKGRMAAVVGNTMDVEGAYALASFLKIRGFGDITYGNYPINVNSDAPFFYGFNRSLDSLEHLGALLLIGTNTRFEASLLNTYLRREQNRRALTYASIGNSANLRFRQAHQGNSLRTLHAFLENRLSVVKQLYNTAGASVMLGFDTLRMRDGNGLQNMARFAGKKFITKTRSGERFGLIHSNVTSLVFTNLGLVPSSRSPLLSTLHRDKSIETLFTAQLPGLRSRRWLSPSTYTHVVALSTHTGGEVLPYDRMIPIKSLYEKSGHLFSLEGRLRKFQKAVTHVGHARSLESYLFSLVRTGRSLGGEGIKGWERTLRVFWGLDQEMPRAILLDRIPAPFLFNPFSIWEEDRKATLSLFHPNLRDFYLTDVISRHSPTMGECSLFLSNEGNFSREN